MTKLKIPERMFSDGVGSQHLQRLQQLQIDFVYFELINDLDKNGLP